MREEFLARLILAVFLRDHPRACGKNGSTMNKDTRGLGSPPRMREELNKGNTTSSLERITPAHAGRIYFTFVTTGTFKDHPRACGKNLEVPEHLHLRLGSPPRMREEFKRPCFSSKSPRITPAHAGRIVNQVLRQVGERDHPRACGKN